MELAVQCSRCGRPTNVSPGEDGACSAICSECIADQTEAERIDRDARLHVHPATRGRKAGKGRSDK